MTSRLWLRHTLLLMGVAAISVLIAIVGLSVFSWANEFVLEGSLPSDVEQELQVLEGLVDSLQEEIEAIFDTWLTPVFNDSRLGLIVAITIVCLLLASGIAFLSARWITRPVNALASQVSALVSGDLKARNAGGWTMRAYGDEITGLMADMNTLAATLEERESRVRNDTAMIAHELRTPLTTIVSHLHAIKDGVIPAKAGEIDILLASAGTLDRIIEDMRTISLVDAGRLTLDRDYLDLAAVLADAAGEHRLAFERANIALVSDLAPAPVYADRQRLLQMLRALLKNILDHATTATEARIQCYTDDGFAVIDVRDNGVGIPEDLDPDTLFKPFARLASTSQNSGLGLAVTASIAAVHDGTQAIDKTKDGWSSFVVRLPLLKN